MNFDLDFFVSLQHLDSRFLVIDVGGYNGDYAQKVLEMGASSVLIFEPNPKSYHRCCLRFKENPKVTVKRIALGDKNEKKKLYLKGISSSLSKDLAGSKSYTIVNLKKASEIAVFKKENYLKLNCEGSEFMIIKDLHKNKLLKNCREILVQFHRLIGKKWEMRNILQETHTCVYSYKWDLWIRK
jgi:FkbM family methyltransferase